MDYDNPQFIAAVKKIANVPLDAIVDALRVIGNELQQQNAAIKEAASSHNESQYPPSLRAELHVPPADRYKKESDNARKSVIGIPKVFLEIFGFIVLVAYTTVAAFQWEEMRKATKASTDAAETAIVALDESKWQFRKTLEEMHDQTKAQQDAVSAAVQAYKVQSNPWVTPAEVKLIDRDPFWRFIKIKTVTFNDGSTPALNVKVMQGPAVFNRRYIDESDFTKYKHFTEEAFKLRAGSVGIIPPHRSWETPDDYTLPLTTVQSGLMQGGGYWLFIIVIVRYEDIFHDTWYTTVCERLEGDRFTVCNAHNSIREIPAKRNKQNN